MRVKSNTPLSDAEMKRIRGILRESKCPNESLHSTFPGMKIRIDGHDIFIGNPPWDVTQELEVEV